MASYSDFIAFPSRRSVVHSTSGIVACTQPLAAQCGLQILAKGGNAADAAVAVAAGMNMTEPCSTGIGGDMFCLFYNARTKQVSALNGSGRSGAKYDLDRIRHDLKIPEGQSGEIPMTSVQSVTVPGAPAGWADTVDNFGSGKVSLEEILSPAAQLGENGFPVSELTASFWALGENKLRKASPNFPEMLKKDDSASDGFRAPKAGELFKNPNLAKTFRALGKDGKKGFYTGRVADEIVKVVKDLGGHIEHEDLIHHMEVGTERVDPISLTFKNEVEVWEHPPNGQGIVALIALGILEELEQSGKIARFEDMKHNSAEYIHAIVESLHIAFADATWWVADPNEVEVPVKGLLSREYLTERAKLFDPSKASNVQHHGSPAHNHSDTVYFAVSDRDGNAVSFINSNYGGFGMAAIPHGCGFTLQNRGANFSLDKNHPNVLAPRKRPYHTIIPAMTTNVADGRLNAAYGVMGGFMQPQGHVQVLLNQMIFKHNAQKALDSPRICIGAGTPDDGNASGQIIYLEDGIEERVAEQLKSMGHDARIVKGDKRSLFGRGQLIQSRIEDGQVVYSAGSDLRGDGAAFPAW
ncbi:gamma-glutamyltranspeptidase [Diplocarpon mali]|nr:gamma-glutamyltranspeptidase [Diplocarpon mali]